MYKKLMVLGAGVFQVPFIEKGKELGLATIAVSKYAGEPGALVADKFYNISTSEIDRLEVIARSENVDRILAPASDFNARVAAVLNERLGFDTVPSGLVENLSDKGLFRKFQKDNGFLVPPFVVASSFEECAEYVQQYDFPFIVKPCRSSGSKGVEIISSEDDLKMYFSRFYSREEKIILEKFLQGKEIGCELFVENNKIAFVGFTEKLKNKSFVPYAHLLPYFLEAEFEKVLMHEIEKLIHVAGYRKGPLNLDVLITEGGPVVLDAGVRSGGNGLPEIFSLFTDTDLINSAVTGTVCRDSTEQAAAVASYIFGSEKEGIVVAINDPVKIVEEHGGSVLKCVFTTGPGKEVRNFSEGSYNTGYIIFTAKTRDTLERIVKKLEKSEIILVDE